MKPNPTPPIMVIILNYQQASLTSRLIQSCLAMAYANLEILLVDNGSQDNSLAHLTHTFPQLKTISLPQNLGYAAGVNAGLRHALAQQVDYTLLLNNDTFVAPNMLTELLHHAQHHSALVSAPLIYYEHQPTTIWSAGAYRQALTRDIKGNLNSQTDPSLSEPFRVDYATACGILVHSSVWHKVGLFDEQFYMYYEDLDWCWRLHEPILLVPTAKMWHRVAATIGGHDSPAERYHMALSSVLFFRKHTQGWRWLIVLPFRALSALRTTGRLRQKPQALRNYWRGLWHGIKA